MENLWADLKRRIEEEPMKLDLDGNKSRSDQEFDRINATTNTRSDQKSRWTY